MTAVAARKVGLRFSARKNSQSLILFILAYTSSVSATGFDPYIGQSRTEIKIQGDGVAAEEKGDYVTARKYFDEAIRQDPKSWTAYYDRATVDYREHKWQQTVEDATEALRLHSSFAASAILRADANAKLGRYDAALAEFDHVSALRIYGKQLAASLNGAAWIRATCPDARYRDGQLALRQAAVAGRITWDRNPNFLDTFAAANAEIGNFNAAIHAEEMALALRTSGQLRKDVELHMAAFREHRAWRENSK
jgi:tetratricopeptide (TPR) repeat protein